MLRFTTMFGRVLVRCVRIMVASMACVRVLQLVFGLQPWMRISDSRQIPRSRLDIQLSQHVVRAR